MAYIKQIKLTNTRPRYLYLADPSTTEFVDCINSYLNKKIYQLYCNHSFVFASKGYTWVYELGIKEARQVESSCHLTCAVCGEVLNIDNFVHSSELSDLASCLNNSGRYTKFYRFVD